MTVKHDAVAISILMNRKGFSPQEVITYLEGGGDPPHTYDPIDTSGVRAEDGQVIIERDRGYANVYRDQHGWKAGGARFS